MPSAAKTTPVSSVPPDMASGSGSFSVSFSPPPAVDESDTFAAEPPVEDDKVDTGEVFLASSTPECSSGLAIVLLGGGGSVVYFYDENLPAVSKKF